MKMKMKKNNNINNSNTGAINVAFGLRALRWEAPPCVKDMEMSQNWFILGMSFILHFFWFSCVFFLCFSFLLCTWMCDKVIGLSTASGNLWYFNEQVWRMRRRREDLHQRPTDLAPWHMCELISELRGRAGVRAEDFLFLTRVQSDGMRYGGTSPSRHSWSQISDVSFLLTLNHRWHLLCVCLAPQTPLGGFVFSLFFVVVVLFFFNKSFQKNIWPNMYISSVKKMSKRMIIYWVCLLCVRLRAWNFLFYF